MFTEKYYGTMRPPEYIKTLKLDKINSQDGASLFIRLFSEFGLLGIAFSIFLIYYCIKSFQMENFVIEQGIAIYILLKLFRDGHYFPPEFYFFLWLFYFAFNSKKNVLNNEENLSHS